MRLLLIGLLALSVAGSAGAGHTKQKLVRIVKHDGAFSATLTYRGYPLLVKPTVSLWEHGHLVLRHRICPLDYGRNAPCQFMTFAYARHGPLRPGFRDVAPDNTPAFEVDLYTGGAHCCVQTFIALGGSHPAWIAHDWENPAYHGERRDGRYLFVSGDNRFDYAFSSYADSWPPSQIWTIRHGSLVEVTRSEPRLVKTNARQAWRWYLGPQGRRGVERGIGILAGWCGDEYLLDRGDACRRALAKAQAHGYLNVGGYGKHGFTRLLNRDFARWGYKRR